MCHSDAPSLFPRTTHAEKSEGAITAYRYRGTTPIGPRLAVVPDIYGCNDFYRGYAAYLAARGASEVFLIDPFAEWGHLAKPSREAAFERRHKVADKSYVGAITIFLAEHRIDGLVGFCLGGLYVFELARRQAVRRLVAYYPFPQGLPNRDPLDVPFDYLGEVRAPHTVILGERDASLGEANLERLLAAAARNPAIDLHVLPGAGHGFLADLESDDSERRRAAEQGLELGNATLFTR